MVKNDIQKTTRYEDFKTILGNRPIFKLAVDRLIKSIMRHDLSAQNPIMVNDKMEVIDGQHRLLALKALGLPVYYIVSHDANLAEVQLLNANVRAWMTVDYLNSYIAQGKPEYIKLKEFSDKHRLSIPTCMRILEDSWDTNVIIPKFREGRFWIKDIDKADNLAGLVSEVRNYSPDDAWRHGECVQALRTLIEQVDPKLFISQVEKYKQVITRRNSIKDYFREFENILSSGREGSTIKLS